MTDFFSNLMIRVFSGGIVCAVALMLAGEGARREIVRICCACFMIVLVVTPIQKAEFSLDFVFEGKTAVETEIAQGMEQSRQGEYNSISAQLCRWVEEEAAHQGIDCKADLVYTVGEDNLFTIVTITITGELDVAQGERVAAFVSEGLGIGREQVILP